MPAARGYSSRTRIAALVLVLAALLALVTFCHGGQAPSAPEKDGAKVGRCRCSSSGDLLLGIAEFKESPPRLQGGFNNYFEANREQILAEIQARRANGERVTSLDLFRIANDRWGKVGGLL